MSVLALVEAIVEDQMRDLADMICDDYKKSVQGNLKHPGNSSGQASGSIHVEQTGATSYRIGSNNLHLYFFEMGNGHGGIPKGGRPPKRPMPMTYGTNGTPQGFAMSASNYRGKNIKSQVAKRWNG